MSIIKLSKQIADPRVAGRTVHKMEHIIYITIAAVIAGAQSWNEIAEFGKSKLDFFKKRLQGLETIPSHDTFNRFFSIFDPKGFEEIFRNWVREIVGEVKGVVAIDGKQQVLLPLMASLCVDQASVMLSTLLGKMTSPTISLTQFLKISSNPFGSKIEKKRLNVSWLGITHRKL